uniref:Uncharacterized LOC111196032 n=1 Tax=Astyanax mexicanus TaxID=7994 RepID=W5L2B7_ASTMX
MFLSSVMESTVDGLIKTSSIEQLMAPFAAQLCYLKLLSESEDEPEQFTQLEAAAHAVAKASKNMAAVASRVMSGCDDEVLKMEMSPLLESLMVSGQHVLLASQKLSIEPHVSEHKEELIEATQNVLLGVVKILLVEDDATVRKITAAAQWLLECLSQVGAATDIRSLLKAFQVYSKAMLLLNNLVAERIQDLRDHRQQVHVKASMESLRKCISMLHTAMYTTIKHPTSEEAQDAKKYILHQVDTTVNDIIITLKTNCEYMSTGLCGYYTERRNRLLRLLSSPDPTTLKDGDFDVVLRDLVFHSMAVGNSARGEMRSCVTANCKVVLQVWSEISQQKTKEHQENLFMSLIKQIQRLDDAVVKATLFQVMDIFIITSGPLDKLVNSAHYMLESEQDGDLDLDLLQPLCNAFIAHADRMVEVANFVSALAIDEKSLESVENSRACLMRLKEGVNPLLMELEGDSVQYQGALHKLINVHQKWAEETEQLLNAFSDVINVKDFIDLAVQEMKFDLDSCTATCRQQDCQLLSQHVSVLIGRMSQVIQFVRRHVDKSDDPIYRNGLLVLVRQAEGSAAEVTGYTSDVFNSILKDDEFSLLVLCEGIDGLQHPNLLSPLREGARQPAMNSIISPVAGPQKSTNETKEFANCAKLLHGDEKDDLPVKLEDEPSKKEDPMIPTKVPTAKVDREVSNPPLIVDSKPVQKPSQNSDLLPLLCEVVHMTSGKDVEALNKACTGVVELSRCYTQAAKDAAIFADTTDNLKMESLRSDLVAITPLLVQTAQETAMSSAKSTDNVFRHSTQFSDLIKNTRKILLPVTGMWYHAIQAMMLHSFTLSMVQDTCIQELTEIMCLCADTVQLVTSADIKVLGEGNCESITSLLNKLQKAQTNTKNLTDLISSNPKQFDELDGPCILWALSIQVLLNSLDRVLGTGATNGRETLQSRHQMTPKKWLASISENSLRIQEAARLSSLNCIDNYTGKLLKELEDGVNTLTEVYLQSAEDLSTVSSPGVLNLAKAEFLQRQLQVKMMALACLLSKVNEEYVTAIQNTVSLALSVINKEDFMEADSLETRTQFEATTELLLGSVETATQSVQDLSRARLMVETRTVFDTFSLDIQTQCWSAKARYLVVELYKVDGILHVTKEQIKFGLQGKVKSSCDLKTDVKLQSLQKEIHHKNIYSHTMYWFESFVQKSVGMPVFSSNVDPTLTYTSLFLKHEAERWDGRGNHIVKVTKEMADKIYHMTQYLRRKGKDDFVTSAKDLILSCQSITEFVKVIADHCLDTHCTKELSIIGEQIITITNQLTIISSVNAVTPGCKSSDEILVKNAQNLLQTVIQGVRAAETACIKGLRQPEPNSEAAKAASLCFQWKKTLLIHRAQEQLNPETDDLGLRKTSLHPSAPSLVPRISALQTQK